MATEYIYIIAIASSTSSIHSLSSILGYGVGTLPLIGFKVITESNESDHVNPYGVPGVPNEYMGSSSREKLGHGRANLNVGFRRASTSTGFAIEEEHSSGLAWLEGLFALRRLC